MNMENPLILMKKEFQKPQCTNECPYMTRSLV